MKKTLLSISILALLYAGCNKDNNAEEGEKPRVYPDSTTFNIPNITELQLRFVYFKC